MSYLTVDKIDTTVVLCHSCFGMWLSLVERLLWEQDAAGSNPVIPTIKGLQKRYSHRKGAVKKQPKKSPRFI